MEYSHRIAVCFFTLLHTMNNAASNTPTAFTTLLTCAQELEKNNQPVQALELYQEILKQTPTHFHALLGAGMVAHQMNRYDQAYEYLTQAATYVPNEHRDFLAIGNALLSLGNKYFDIRQPEKAIATFKKILLLSDSLNAVHHNIAFTLSEQQGAYQESLDYYRKALAAQPNNTETHFCYSLSLLATGNLLEGFSEYEYRWKRFKHSPRNFAHYPLPQLWTGLQDLSNKRILLHVEQGLGDTLMFIRYALILKERGATVIAQVQRPLVSLLALCPYLDEIIPIGAPLPHYDYEIPLLNLPLAFKTTLATIPCSIPYLYANPERVAFWKDTLNNNSFKIGICWRGDAAHSDHKFMPFSYFQRVATIPGITLYSLQKNDPASSLKPADQAHNSAIVQFDADFDQSHGRFMDTAAVMKNLDLVITVDTSIAHLAGGLGVPTWLLVPFPAEWRWLEHRKDSPWYPSMRIFRQKKYGEWESVVSEIENALQHVQ